MEVMNVSNAQLIANIVPPLVNVLSVIQLILLLMAIAANIVQPALTKHPVAATIVSLPAYLAPHPLRVLLVFLDTGSITAAHTQLLPAQ